MKTFRTLTLGLCVAAIGAIALPASASTATTPPPATATAISQPSVSSQPNLAALFTVQNNAPDAPGAAGGGFGGNTPQAPGAGNFRGGAGGGGMNVLMTIAPDGNIYILRGNTLYKISPDMKILGQVSLPLPQGMQGGAEGRGFRGGNGAGGAGADGGGQQSPNGQPTPPPAQ